MARKILNPFGEHRECAGRKLGWIWPWKKILSSWLCLECSPIESSANQTLQGRLALSHVKCFNVAQKSSTRLGSPWKRPIFFHYSYRSIHWTSQSQFWVPVITAELGVRGKKKMIGRRLYFSGQLSLE